MLGVASLHFQFEDRMQSAHRVAWIIANGQFDRSLCILHKCDNPVCVRPDHLFLGTVADNNQDKLDKGRMYTGDTRGEKSGNAKMTNAIVLENAGTVSCR